MMDEDLGGNILRVIDRYCESDALEWDKQQEAIKGIQALLASEYDRGKREIATQAVSLLENYGKHHGWCDWPGECTCRLELEKSKLKGGSEDD